MTDYTIQSAIEAIIDRYNVGLDEAVALWSGKEKVTYASGIKYIAGLNDNAEVSVALKGISGLNWDISDTDILIRLADVYSSATDGVDFDIWDCGDSTASPDYTFDGGLSNYQYWSIDSLVSAPSAQRLVADGGGSDVVYTRTIIDGAPLGGTAVYSGNLWDGGIPQRTTEPAGVTISGGSTPTTIQFGVLNGGNPGADFDGGLSSTASFAWTVDGTDSTYLLYPADGGSSKYTDDPISFIGGVSDDTFTVGYLDGGSTSGTVNLSNAIYDGGNA